MYHVPCTMYHVPCTMYHVPCTMYHVPCTMYHVPCTNAPCTNAPSTTYHVQVTKVLYNTPYAGRRVPHLSHVSCFIDCRPRPPWHPLHAVCSLLIPLGRGRGDGRGLPGRLPRQELGPTNSSPPLPPEPASAPKEGDMDFQGAWTFQGLV